MLGEPEVIAEERKMLNSTLSVLRNAVKILERDPEISSSLLSEEELRAEAGRLKRKYEE